MSNEMSQWLASIYGTDGADDIEKTAEAILLDKLAAENNVDLSQFSPEELQQLLAEVLGEEEAQAQMGAVPGAAFDQAQQQVAPQGQIDPNQFGQVAPQAQQAQQPQQFSAFAPPAHLQQQVQPQQAQQPQIPAGVMQQQSVQPSQDALMKEAQAKFEEADLLGRVMAHAYTQELEKIAAAKTEKTAGKMPVPGGIGRKMQMGALKAKMKGRAAAEDAGSAVKGLVNKHPKATAAVAGAAAFGAGRASKKTKEASAFEKLAEMQAAEILGAAGFDPATGIDTLAPQEQQGQEQVQPFLQQGQPQNQQVAGQEQGQVGQEEFQSALDNRALEMLAAAGYDVEEILARLSQQQGVEA